MVGVVGGTFGGGTGGGGTAVMTVGDVEAADLFLEPERKFAAAVLIHAPQGVLDPVNGGEVKEGCLFHLIGDDGIDVVGVLIGQEGTYVF